MIAIATEISMLKKKNEYRVHFSISEQGNTVISQAIIERIVSIDRTHNILFTNEHIIKRLCILKLVSALLGFQCQSRRGVYPQSSLHLIQSSSSSPIFLSLILSITFFRSTYAHCKVQTILHILLLLSLFCTCMNSNIIITLFQIPMNTYKTLLNINFKSDC